MGRGCNRLTLKVRQRRSWRRNKLRLKRKIEEAKANKGKGGAKAAPASSAPATIRRPGDEG